MKISSDDVVVRSKNILSAELHGQVVIMSEVGQKYYLLSETALCIWELIENSIKISDLINLIMNKYGKSYSEIESDVIDFLNYMRDRGVIEISNKG